MINALHVVVFPRIRMGVELDQAERAIFLGVRLEDRKANVVIAT